MKRILILLFVFITFSMFGQTNITGGSGINKVATLANLKTSTAVSNTFIDVGRFYMVMADSGVYIQRGTQVHRINRIKSATAPLFFDGVVINTNVDWEDSNGNIWYADPKGYNAWVIKNTQMLKANFPLPYTSATGSSSATFIPQITNSTDTIPYIAKGNTTTGYYYEPLIPPRTSLFTQLYSQTLASGAKIITKMIRDTALALDNRENLFVNNPNKLFNWQPLENLTIENFGAATTRTDNTTYIQRAISYSSLTASDYVIGENKVIIPEGVFLTSGFTLGSINPLIMEGAGTLKLINNGNASILTFSSNSITIDGITFDGNATNQTTNTDAFGACILNNGSSYIKIRNCIFKNCRRSAIYEAGTITNCYTENNIIEQSQNYGIQLGTVSTIRNNKYIKNIIKNCGSHGFKLDNVTSSEFVENKLYDCINAFKCLLAGGTDSLVFKNNFYSSSSAFTTNQSMFDLTGSNTVLDGNTCFNAGVFVYANGSSLPKNIVITNNYTNKTGNSFGGSIVLNGGLNSGGYSYDNAYKYGITCDGNTLVDCPYGGIILSAIRGATIQNNIIRGINTLIDSSASNRYQCGIALRSYSNECTIKNNIVDGGTSANHNYGVVELNDGSEAPANNAIINNQISNVLSDILIAEHGSNQSYIERSFVKTTPIDGNYYKNQVTKKSLQSTNSTDAIYCTQKGTLGTNNTTGSITSGSNFLTVVKATGYQTGQFVKVVGAGVAGVDLITTINNINHSSNIITLSVTASTTVTNAAVSLSNPTFEYFNTAKIKFNITYNTLIAGSSSSGDINISVPGAVAGDVFGYTLGAGGLPAGVVVQDIRVSTSDVVTIRLFNTNVTSSTPNVIIYITK